MIYLIISQLILKKNESRLTIIEARGVELTAQVEHIVVTDLDLGIRLFPVTLVVEISHNSPPVNVRILTRLKHCNTVTSLKPHLLTGCHSKERMVLYEI